MKFNKIRLLFMHHYKLLLLFISFTLDVFRYMLNMAAAAENSKSLEELLNDLDCPVCLESNDLLLLPCQHRFCKICIGKVCCHLSASIKIFLMNFLSFAMIA